MTDEQARAITMILAKMNGWPWPPVTGTSNVIVVPDAN
jgi:hypothetical protein